ncbi:MAG: hypothetical protein EA370_04730 [Wenzhouxiangella sp.]|nr:MAG: hypothetical protein EA370_04730 [Wenzhouxiangella sp.]
MLELMAWLENSALAEVLRGLGIWTYGLLNLTHIIGIATLFGAILVLDLRLIGLWRRLALDDLVKPTVMLSAIGFTLAILSGVMMFSFNATEYHGNPFFYIKIPVILVGVINIVVIQRTATWKRAVNGEPETGNDSLKLKFIGASSLLIWLTVLTCGRMIGYW